MSRTKKFTESTSNSRTFLKFQKSKAMKTTLSDNPVFMVLALLISIILEAFRKEIEYL
jgi:hypothetical protein